ncbi:hypothetical protein M9458_036908, partial [Cirrhinus mrigala]
YHGTELEVTMLRCVESVLLQSGTPQDPEPSPLSLCCIEQEPEPTTDGELKPIEATGLRIAPEPEPHAMSDQMQEPATELTTGESAMDSESLEGSSAHCTIAKGELSSVDCILPALPSSSSAYPEPSICHELSAFPEATMEVVPLSLALRVTLWCVWAAHTVSNPPDHSELPPSLSLPSPLHQSSPSSPLSPGSPSAYPQPTICVGSPRVCQSPSVSWLEDPLSTLRPELRLSPPSVHQLCWAPSSFQLHTGHSAPPATPRPSGSVRLLLPSGSTLVLCCSGSTVAFSLEPSGLPWPSGSSALPCLIGSQSLPRTPLLPAPPPSVGPLESSALSPPWLLPLSAPQWVAFMAADWVPPGSSCSKSLLSSPWLLPLSEPPWLLLCSP